MKNKTIITSALIALAAGIAVYVYNKRRNSISNSAEDAYDIMSDTIDSTERQTENLFS